jgi:DNA-binding response OmpR family regulator
MTKRPYVLVVEDDEWLAEQHARTLKSEGMEVKRAGDALMAIEAMDQRRPDMLLLDVLLPGPNAFTLLHELHSHSDLAELPVILCTNSADSLVKEDVTAYGVVSILDKTTMRPHELVAAVRKILL